MTVEWKELPPDPRGRPGKVREIVKELQTRPGEWALVEHDASSNRALSFRKKGCQVSVRKIETGGYDIYARWPAL